MLFNILQQHFPVSVRPSHPVALGKLHQGLLAITVLGAFIAHGSAMQSYRFEDAFITFRYASNLAEGLGFVFNHGERVLGTSTPLLTLLLAGLGRLGLDVPTIGGWLYVAALHGSGLLGAWLLGRHGFAHAGVVFALMTVWGVGESLAYFGMETTLHLFLILAAILAADLERPTTTGIILGLLCLNRYDGVLIAVVVGCFLWSRRRRPPWTEAVVAFLIFGTWLAFAQHYFGSIFPNTLGAKAGSSHVASYLAATVEFQLSVLASPIKEYAGALDPGTEAGLGVLLFLPAILVSPFLMRARPALAMLPACTTLLLLGYALIGPPPRHQWYHLPGLYLLCAFAVASWAYGLTWLAERAWPRRHAMVTSWLCLCLLVFSLVELPERADARCKAYGRKASQDKVNAYETFADFIVERSLHNTSVLTHEPGFLTYTTGQRAIDAAGLVSRDIYYHGPKARHTGWYSLLQRYRPDFAVASAPTDQLDARMLASFVPVAMAPPHFVLFMERQLFRKRLSSLLEAPEDPSTPTDRASLKTGWTFRGKPVNNVQGTGAAWSPEILVDFDELVLDVGASSPQTKLQLLVDDLMVMQLDGRSVSSEVQRRGVPVYPWRGRTLRLRVIDHDPEGSLQLRELRTRVYGKAEMIDDFESWRLGPFWQSSPARQATPAQQTGSTMQTPVETLAEHFGTQSIQGRGAASSFGLSGPQELRSRALPIEHDRWVMSIFDGGSSKTGVHLWVDGQRVLSWMGRGSGLVHMLKWDLRPWKGRNGVLVIQDGDPDPNIGIAVDSILGLWL